MKKLILSFFTFLSVFWRLFPRRFRQFFFFSMFLLESRGKDSVSALKQLFSIDDKLQLVINERSLSYGNGIHPKHKLINYHEFFISYLTDSKVIVDFGCGYGEVARSVAKALPKSKVIGVENDKSRYEQAIKLESFDNLHFELIDIYDWVSEKPVDAVILSNVIEHIVERKSFLKHILETSNPKLVLIRVPCFERSWTVPMRKKLGVNYFLDPDHKIEHRRAEIVEEINSVGLRIQNMVSNWGEYWIACTNETR